MERLKHINDLVKYNNEYLEDSIKAYKLIIRLIKEYEPQNIPRIKLYENQIETIEYLMSVYSTHEGPLVYPILLKEGVNIGYVQLVPLNEEEYEIGYHIAKKHTKKGYATEAVNAFLIHLKSLGLKNIFGITLSNNYASIKVLEKTGFKQVFKGVSTYQDEEKEIVKYIYDF